MSQQIAGHCHCHSVRVILETGLASDALPLRACQCSFCRSRGAVTTADPAGHLFVEAAPGSLNHYQFGLGVTDFLLCVECGTYVAAAMEIDGRQMGVVNVLGAAMPGLDARTPEPLTYDHETAEQRTARRRDRWMPITVVEAQPNA